MSILKDYGETGADITPAYFCFPEIDDKILVSFERWEI